MNKNLMTTIEVGGLDFAVYLEPDELTGPPWENSDCHGPVSEWTTRKKTPGEIVLCEDRNSRRYYDYQEACRIARKDGWGYEGSTGTKREIAAAAAMRDYNYLRQWCDDQWSYVGVTVELLDDDGDGMGICESLFGVEDIGDYCLEVAKELGSEIILSCRRMAA